MSEYAFTVTLVLEASSEGEAKERAENFIQNVTDLLGHSPFPCQLDLLQDDCRKVE